MKILPSIILKTALVALLFGAAQSVSAAPTCNEPKESWKDQSAFKKSLEETYSIKVFKVTKGNCYEIYGHRKSDGAKVEIYFNPATGAVLKEEIQPVKK